MMREVNNYAAVGSEREVNNYGAVGSEESGSFDRLLVSSKLLELLISSKLSRSFKLLGLLSKKKLLVLESSVLSPMSTI
jgi:hypothetical protein